ncbi:MAG: thiolase family protein [Betaproteobacteria bacterium]|nr:MAG: thiolase family protein [Betaproteobacteria bacterium]
MQDVYIVGVGMTPFGRHLDRTEKQLTAQAVEDALRDAACERKRLGAAFYGNCGQGYMQGQHMIRGQVALLPLGLQGIPVTNVENACATASTAFHMALAYVRSGSADVALAVGSEKMYSTDRAKMFGVFDSAWDLDLVEQTRNGFIAMGKGIEPPAGSTSPKPYSPFMDIYAGFARRYMKRFGITQRQLALIASKNHAHSVHNPRSQFRAAMSTDEVLAAAPITYPLTLPMCSPISDGSAAAIVCTGEALSRYGFDRKRAVRVLASVMRSASARDADDLEHHLTRLAAKSAYEQAGLGPQDIHVAEVHDATSMGELMQTEMLGFCGFGEGGGFAESGATSLGGRIPVNTSGGLESKGHPIGATGLGQIFELVGQLRGECGARQVEGARIAIQENGGGIWGIEESAAHIGIYAAA